MKTSHVLSTILLCSIALSCSSKKTIIPAQVMRISEEYANINTDLTGPTLTENGIVEKTYFNVRFKNHTMRTMLGKTYSDVPKGDWIALIEEDEKVQFAISFGNAATEIGCTLGDTLYIQVPDTELKESNSTRMPK